MDTSNQLWVNPGLSPGHRARLMRRLARTLLHLQWLLDNAKNARQVRRLKYWGRIGEKLERKLFVIPKPEQAAAFRAEQERG
jgi:hypothetical protein